MCTPIYSCNTTLMTSKCRHSSDLPLNRRGIRRKVGWFALGLMGNNTIVEAPGDPLGFQYDCSLQRLFLPKWTTNLVATLLPKVGLFAQESPEYGCATFHCSFPFRFRDEIQLRAQFGGERTLSLVPVQCFEVQEQFLRWWYTHSRHRAPLLTYHGMDPETADIILFRFLFLLCWSLITCTLLLILHSTAMICSCTDAQCTTHRRNKLSRCTEYHQRGLQSDVWEGHLQRICTRKRRVQHL